MTASRVLWQATLLPHRHEDSEVRVVMEVDTDFADLFEVKDGVVAERDVSCDHDDRTLTFAYERASFRRSLTISASCPATITRRGFTYLLRLAPGERWSNTFTITPHAAQPGIAFTRRRPRGTLAELSVSKSAEHEEWLARAPVLQTEDAALMRTYRASLSDLDALRLHPDLSGGATLPAAGLPWFMALFGRDSLITSFQALPYLPELAATTLRVLAAARPRAATTSTSRSRARSCMSCVSGSSRRGGAPAFPVLRHRRRHAPVPHPSGRVPPLVGRRGARPRAGAQRTCRPGVDRGQRGRRWRRICRVRPAATWPPDRLTMLEGQLGRDPVRRRHARPGADCDLRDPGIRVRRPSPGGPSGARGVGR